MFRIIHHSLLCLCTFAMMAACAGDIAVEKRGSLCPKGSRLAVSSQGTAACLFRSFHLPDAGDLEVVCDDLSDGRFFYRWVENPWTVGYRCPTGASRIHTPGGYGACVYTGLTPPTTDGRAPTCGRTDEGRLGFSWRLDPTVSYTEQLAVRLATHGPETVPILN